MRAFRPATVSISDLRQNAICTFWYNGNCRRGRIDRVTSRNVTLELLSDDAPLHTTHVNSGVYKCFTISKIEGWIHVSCQATRANGCSIGMFESP